MYMNIHIYIYYVYTSAQLHCLPEMNRRSWGAEQESHGGGQELTRPRDSDLS